MQELEASVVLLLVTGEFEQDVWLQPGTSLSVLHERSDPGGGLASMSAKLGLYFSF